MRTLGIPTGALAWRSSLHANSFYLMATNVENAAFGFMFWTAAARLYEAKEVGLAAAAVSAVGLLGMLATLGLDQAMVRFVPRTDNPRGSSTRRSPSERRPRCCWVWVSSRVWASGRRRCCRFGGNR